MPSPLDFHRAKVQAFEKVLFCKTAGEKKGQVPIALAEQFNAIVEDIKKQAPDTTKL
ncbi:hypothetical protein J0H58_12825 [bacterium]|nr:hypothetical protein [bacterium]